MARGFLPRHEDVVPRVCGEDQWEAGLPFWVAKHPSEQLVGHLFGDLVGRETAVGPVPLRHAERRAKERKCYQRRVARREHTGAPARVDHAAQAPIEPTLQPAHERVALLRESVAGAQDVGVAVEVVEVVADQVAGGVAQGDLRRQAAVDLGVQPLRRLSDRGRADLGVEISSLLRK